MNKRQRVLAAIDGERPDRAPIALWRHWPLVDQTAEGLAAAVAEWQIKYDFDLVKVTAASGYSIEDWGARFEQRGNRDGTRDYVDRPIKAVRDWGKLWPLDVRQGVLGRELRALRLIRARVGPDVFVLPTLFSPLSLARNLAGEELLLESMRNHPQELRRALAIITDTFARYAAECVRSGADGVFFATQCATRDLLTEDEYEEFGVPYDRHILGAVDGISRLSLLHIHGVNIMFDLLTQAYPVQVVNWHDRLTSPSLAAARGKTRLALMGGLSEWRSLAEGTPEQVTAEVRDAIAQTGGTRYLAGAGCVIPIDTPEANISAARAAVE